MLNFTHWSTWFLPQCGNGWTSMKGRVMFWFLLDSGSNTGFVYFRLFGQRCSKCNDPEFVHAMWYPEEVVKVWPLSILQESKTIMTLHSLMIYHHFLSCRWCKTSSFVLAQCTTTSKPQPSPSHAVKASHAISTTPNCVKHAQKEFAGRASLPAECAFLNHDLASEFHLIACHALVHKRLMSHIHFIECFVIYLLSVFLAIVLNPVYECTLCLAKSLSAFVF